MSKSSSVLFGLESVTVERVERGPDGKRMVHLLTAEPWVGLCPECGVRSTVSNGWTRTRPRDVRFGPDRPLLVWRKWVCSNGLCERRAFTESTPDFPARCRVSARSKQQMAAAVLDEDRSVKSAAASFGCDWKICHRTVVAVADAVLTGEPGPVRVLGIDETRSGKAKWETCPDTGTRTWVDRWDTDLVDITGTQGLLGQVNGRTSKSVTDWLAQRDQGLRDGIRFVSIDVSAVYANAVREALPNASLVVDRFHLVKRAN